MSLKATCYLACFQPHSTAVRPHEWGEPGSVGLSPFLLREIVEAVLRPCEFFILIMMIKMNIIGDLPAKSFMNGETFKSASSPKASVVDGNINANLMMMMMSPF